MKELHIDMQRMKPAVLKEVAERLDGRMADLMQPGPHQADALWALAYAVGRRIEPTLTWEQAGEIDVYLENVQVPPTGAAGSGPKRR